MRSRLIAALASVALLATPAIASPTNLTSSTPTLTPLPGSLPLTLPGAIALGAAPGEQYQRVTLALSLRDRAGLDKLLHDQQTAGTPDYQRWLTPAEFAARFAPSPSAVAVATSWARSKGLTVTEVSANRTVVTIEATSARLARALAVQLKAFRFEGQAYVTPDRPATLPTELRRVSVALLGLTTYNPMRTLNVQPQAGYQPYALASYRPADFEVIYNAPRSHQGVGQSVAVITDGDLRGVKSDLASFQARNRLRRVPLTVIQTTRTTTKSPNAIEYALDTQYSLGFAPGISRLYAYNGDVLGAIQPLNRFVVERRAKTASGSYGGCEGINHFFGAVAAFDQVFRQGVAQGQTFWFSSGDSGSSCTRDLNSGTAEGFPEVLYPASSRYVVAVGGTSLTGLKNQPVREISWTGGGGGHSNVEDAPSWQRSNGQFQREQGRGLPDISLAADPASGYEIIFRGQAITIGGTSASAPAWNGIWARALQRQPRLGFAAPLLYRNRGGLVDITVGNNGAFVATPGFDLTTGLGTADISALVTTLR